MEIYEGWLFKQAGTGIKKWQKRWFVVLPECIKYGPKKGELKNQILATEIHQIYSTIHADILKNIPSSYRDYCFSITLSSTDRVYYLSAMSDTDKDAWVSRLQAWKKDYDNRNQKRTSEWEQYRTTRRPSVRSQQSVMQERLQKVMEEEDDETQNHQPPISGIIKSRRDSSDSCDTASTNSEANNSTSINTKISTGVDVNASANNTQQEENHNEIVQQEFHHNTATNTTNTTNGHSLPEDEDYFNDDDIQIEYRDEPVQQPKQEHKLKLIVIGDSGVGKTSLVNFYITKNFSNAHRATIGVDIVVKKVELENMIVSLEIFDTAGQERFHSLGMSYYRNANACIIVFDVCDAQSFKNLSRWRDEFLQKSGTDSYLVVMGNKIDKNERVVSQQEAMEWCARHSIPYFETSARQAINIELAMQSLALNTVKAISEKESQRSGSINSGNQKATDTNRSNSTGLIMPPKSVTLDVPKDGTNDSLPVSEAKPCCI